MEIWTIQIAQWRLAEKLGVELIDTTVKTNKSIFAPTWAMVSDFKKGRITEQVYTDLYYALMRDRYAASPNAWKYFLQKPKVAIGCYCSPDTFCHRHLLVDILEKVANQNNLHFKRMGEIKGEQK